MTLSNLKLGLVLASCTLAITVSQRAAAQPNVTAPANPSLQEASSSPVSPADFQKLQEAVQKLSEQVKTLQDANMDLKGQLDQTQQTAQDAEQKSTAASQSAQQNAFQAPLDEATVNHNFQILGDAEFQYAKQDQSHGAFFLADFAPIFLYRASDNILFEAGFDFILQNNSPSSSGYTTTINLSFAQIDYVVNDYATLCVGNLVLPLGTYSERSAGWLNKLPDSPLSRSIVPGTGVGAEVRGAIPWGNDGKFFNYSVWGVNGPGSSDGTGNAGSLDIAGGNVGIRSDGAIANLHSDPSGGARLGLFLPFAQPHTDLELGISGQSGAWDNAGQHLWTAAVFDAALHIGPNFEAKGEYMRSWYGSDDLGLIRPEGWWVQAGYKLAGLNLNLPVINNTELVGRYDSLNDGFGTATRRETAGFIYYFTNTFLLEGDYEFIQTPDPSQPSNNIIVQLSLGF